MGIILSAALQYAAYGLSVVPVYENKQPAVTWKAFQCTAMTPRQIHRYFNRPGVNGLALICGIASNNIEVIDVDSKYDLSGTLIHRFLESLDEQVPGLSQRLCIAMTRNNGYHFFYRAAVIGRDMLLARRHTTAEEKRARPGDLCKVLIETRGDGGYVLVEPSPGYIMYQGSLSDIPFITEAERSVMLAVARRFNSYTEMITIPKLRMRQYETSDMPLTAYNWSPDRRENLLALLVKHGWTIGRSTSRKTYVRRPGKTNSTSGDYHHDLNLLTIFSTSTPFLPVKGYRPAAVYAVLECNGDFSVAAKQLLLAGYGRPYRFLMN